MKMCLQSLITTYVAIFVVVYVLSHCIMMIALFVIIAYHCSTIANVISSITASWPM